MLTTVGQGTRNDIVRSRTDSVELLNLLPACFARSAVPLSGGQDGSTSRYVQLTGDPQGILRKDHSSKYRYQR